MTEVMLMIGGFLVILALGVPIGVSMVFAGVITVLATGSTSAYFQAIAQKMYGGIDNFALMSIPFFLLAGNIMDQGGISIRLISFFKLVLRRLPATTAIITTVASAFFGALTGSAPATVAAIGGITIPIMEKDGYPKGEATAIAAASGILGPIIPPSITMIAYSVAASVSISTMFLAGIIPGLMIALAYVIVELILYRKYEKGEKGGLPKGELWKAFKNAQWALGMPVIILGGIYGGIFTPTEAAAVSCVYSLIIAVFVYKEIGLKALPNIFYRSVLSTAMILFILCLASGYGWLMANFRIINVISGILLGVGSKIVIMLVVNVIGLILGCFVEAISIIIILTPILLPVAQSIGLHPIALGLILVVNVAIGAITPPLAPNLFVAANVANTRSIGPTSKAVLPLLGGAVFVLFIITYFPETVLFVPRLFGYIK